MTKGPRRTTLLKLAATVIVTALAVVAQMHNSASAQDQPARLFEIVGMSVPFEQRIGVDDVAVFVVHFAGDTRGSLDTCG